MKTIIVTAIIIALVGWVFVYAPVNGIHFVTGEGEHTGYITSVEKTGLFWKTGTAYIKSDVSSSQEESYCVPDDAVYKELSELSKNKSKVTIKYLEWFVKGLSVCDGELGGVITAVIK